MSIYSIAKMINYELLIEEQLQVQSTSSSKIIEKYSKNKISLKFKVISLKLFNAIIFAVLPIFPLIAYFNIEEYFMSNQVPTEVNFLIKSLIFVIFFGLQITDFLLMGIFNSINIMSGTIFNWFKTLPLPEKRLRRLVMVALFQNYDLTFIIMIFSFPFMMLFVTYDIILFLICLGVSLLSAFFSFCFLIVLGKSLVKFMNRHGYKPNRSILFQFLNVFSYTILIFGSILIVQLTLSSVSELLSSFLNYRYSPLLNLIFTLIPFPFNPSYIITFFTQPQEISFLLLNNTLLGFALFSLLIYTFYNRSVKAINQIISLKYKPIHSNLMSKEDTIYIKVSRSLIAYIKKDLIIASRNLQTFMSFLMPVIFSFVFIFYYNTAFTGGGTLLKVDMYINGLIILAFQPIISSMLVYNILNIESSGNTILVSLPIKPRDRAKAKLYIMIFVQVIAVILPAFIYVFNTRFIHILLCFTLILPFSVIFLIIIFLLRIKLFGKERNTYSIDEKHPLNKSSKWISIIMVVYGIYFVLSFFSSPLYFSQNYSSLFMLLSSVSLIFIMVLYRIFNKYFPIK